MSEVSDDRRWPRSLYDVGDEPDPRFSLANERTFLAWVRTALALIALGAALHTLAPELGDEHLARSYSLGSAVLGVLCALEAFRRWYTTERALRAHRPLGGGRAAVALTAVLVLVGAVVLITTWTL